MILCRFAFAASLICFASVATGQSPPAAIDADSPPSAAPPAALDSTDAYPTDADPTETAGWTPSLSAFGVPKAAPTKYPSVTVNGLLQADAGWFDQQPQNVLSVGDVQDGADLRRTRLAAKGSVAENVQYLVEMDFSLLGHPSFMDVIGDISDLPIGTVRIGHWRQPFGMSVLTSVRELPFLERALPSAFAPFRQIGVGFFNHSEHEMVTWAASAFRFPSDQYGNNVGDNGGYGMATRVTGLGIYDESSGGVLHAGFSYSLVDPSNDLVRYVSTPEVFIGQTDVVAGNIPSPSPSVTPFFVDTGLLSAQNIQLFGGELAAARGSALVQSEWIVADVLMLDSERTVLSGGSVHGSWVLTGERRPYNRTAGVFQGVAPDNEFRRGGGWGAWEVAGRWSYLDLSDGSVQGGQLHDLTFGVNWYLNKFAKFQFNYIRPMLDDPALGESHANVFATRFQVGF